MPSAPLQEALPEGVAVLGPAGDRHDEILTPDALRFVADLHRRFDGRRQELLRARDGRQARFDAGALPGFLPETASVRDDPDWRVGPIPAPLQDRRVEITGPVDRKMMINALNSGAKVFMADFEDSNSPTWDNCVTGQVNVKDAVRRTLRLETEKKTYELAEDIAVLVLRPRGWHLLEKHLEVDGAPVSAGLFDFGLSFYHNAKEQLACGLGPYYYLPKLEHHREARLWDDVFTHAQKTLGVPHGSVKATVLVETFPAVFQMEEILYELRDHMAGLNAGRWDYLFSCIKTTRNHPEKVLPDRAQVTMTAPFMRAYTELLAKTCHKRGAFAMGGMSAFIPDRRDLEVTEKALAAVRADKEREAGDGCDGTWVAHPDLVPVALDVFDRVLQGAPNQAQRQRDDVATTEADLQDFRIDGGTVTQAGLRTNLDVGLRYIDSWLRGNGAAALYNLMEDAATAEICRSQVWQWTQNAVEVDGTPLHRDHVDAVLAEVLAAAKAECGDSPHRLDEAADLLAQVCLTDDFPDFLTLPAYDVLTQETRP